MGQRIEIESSRVVDDSVIVTTNRSITGTDGEGYTSVDQACAAETFASKLASDLFESDDATARVYVASNVLIILRKGGWQSDALDGASTVISDFFLHY